MKRLLVLFLFVAGIQANAQVQPAELLSGKPYIEVTGTSETEITPDEIYVVITLQERAENKEKLNIEKQEETLKNSLKELGIDLSNLTLNNANSDYRKVKSLGKDVIISKSYTLKIAQAEMLSKVYEKLDKMNAFDAYISKLSHSKITEYQKENRLKAIKAAKDKAEYLLVAIGKQAGQPLQVIEADNSVQNTPYNYYNNYYYRGGRVGNAVQSYNSANSVSEGGAGNDDISIKKIKVVSSFLVKYEIK
jgi:uncharacterized protein YggE